MRSPLLAVENRSGALPLAPELRARADDFAALLERAGFAGPRRWSDPAGWFAVFAAFAGDRQ